MATADIQKIYLGLLARPADEAGLAYWNEKIEEGTLTFEQLRANIVNEQSEFAAGLGQLSRGDFLAQLYSNMFGREPGEGAEYWLTGEGANVQVDSLVFAFMEGASEQDTEALNNRASVAQLITDANLSLEGDAAALLDGVTDDPNTVTAAEQAIEALINGAEEPSDSGSGGSVGGGVGGNPVFQVKEELNAEGHVTFTFNNEAQPVTLIINADNHIVFTDADGELQNTGRGVSEVATGGIPRVTMDVEAASSVGSLDNVTGIDLVDSAARLTETIADVIVATAQSVRVVDTATVEQAEAIAGDVTGVLTFAKNIEGSATELNGLDFSAAAVNGQIIAQPADGEDITGLDLSSADVININDAESATVMLNQTNKLALNETGAYRLKDTAAALLEAGAELLNGADRVIVDGDATIDQIQQLVDMGGALENISYRLGDELAITLELAEDTGIADDGITSNGVVITSGLEADATWQYSVNGGTDWIDGTGDFFELSEGEYEAGDVLARQSNAAGITSSNSNLGAVEIDTTPPVAPTVALANDNGFSDTDKLTNDGTIDVAGLETDASWVYSLNAGIDWTAGQGSSFELAEGSYAVGDIQVRQTDLAGNQSGIDSSDAEIVIDTTPPISPSVDLATDSGIEGNNITNDGTLVFNTSGNTDDEIIEYKINDGEWATTAPEVQTDGDYTVSIRAVDAAGNVSKSTLDFTLDTIAAAPSVVLANDNGINGNNITNNSSLNVIDTEQDALIEFSLDDGESWSENYIAPTAEGEYTVQARQTDVAGNVSDPGSITFTLDTTAPSVDSTSVNYLSNGIWLDNLVFNMDEEVFGNPDVGGTGTNAATTVEVGNDPTTVIVSYSVGYMPSGNSIVRVTGLSDVAGNNTLIEYTF